LNEEVENFTDPKDIPVEEGREIIVVGDKERHDGGKLLRLPQVHR